MSTRNQQRPAVAALIAAAGVLVGWWALPPTVLGGGAQEGPRHLAVSALLIAALALLAAGVVGWLSRRRPLRLAVRATAVAGLFAVLLLVTAPVQGFLYDRLAPAPIEPNLAAVRYDTSCPSIITATECQQVQQAFGGLDAAGLERSHHAMMAETGHSAEAHAAMNAPFMADDGPGLGAEAAAFAVEDAGIVFLIALPLLLLAGAVASRIPVRAPPARHRHLWLNKIRSRRTAFAATIGLVVVGNVVLVASAATAAVTPWSVQLKIPPVLQGSQVTLQMREANVQIMPTGPATRMWTYNGSFPAPTIRRPSGQTTRITFRNDLPVTFGEATIHHHGSHSRPSEDGQPDDFLIPPGSLRTYTYEHRERGENEWAATQWYHDHRMDVTGRNVWNGLVGMFILDDPLDQSLPLPRGEFDVPLAITDRTFDANNQIPYTFNIVGTLGDTWLVNGRPQPYFDVGDRKYRFRILNSANRRPMVLALSNGAPMLQIGTDAGLLPAPVSRTSIVLQPAERVEIVVDFAGLLGQNVVLRDTNTPGTAGNPPPDLLQFRVNRDLTETSSVPAVLRPAPTFPAPTVEREYHLEAQIDAAGNIATWTINDQLFSSGRIDAEPVLGSTERWTFFNTSPQPHAIHLHDVDWKLDARFNVTVDAAGNPVRGSPLAIAPHESGVKETFFVPANTGFSVLTTFTDHVGEYVFHCHMLEHEDMAMMATFNVRRA
ncbi:multicopper oxidase family protein [Actinomycetes bacterium KLBMP 9797]